MASLTQATTNSKQGLATATLPVKMADIYYACGWTHTWTGGPSASIVSFGHTTTTVSVTIMNIDNSTATPQQKMTWWVKGYAA